MVKIYGGNASIYQWKLLYQTVINAVTIGEICERYSEEITFFRKIKETLKDSLYNMINCMSCVIDFEQSTVQNRFVVKSGFIPELDEKKSKFENISHILNEIALQELQDLPPYIRECSIRKIPEVGFLLCLPLWKPSSEMTENDYKIQNFEFKWLLTDNVFYKTSRCYELDQLFGEIESSIIQEEIQIMIKLTEHITQQWIGELHEILNLIAELDCLIGFADVARDLKLIKPVILPKEHCIINIVNGRHILQEKFVDIFIPNSYNSSKINQPIKIVTGFNSSGKSIYLKQVGLISYLCHIGCYVPAEYTEISVLDHIHTRIQSTESISTLMSAFMVDLRQMSVALNESTSRSLVILDEFGKGTSEINGLALLLACLSNFANRPSNTLPHVIISTHFHSLPNLLQQIIHKDVHHNIKYLSMSHKIENSEIIYLYKVLDELKSQNMSMAHTIAALNGLPTSIVERATQIFQLIQRGECVKPVIENLRYKLFSRRKQYIEKVLDSMQDEIDNNTYKDLLDDLENIRYP